MRAPRGCEQCHASVFRVSSVPGFPLSGTPLWYPGTPLWYSFSLSQSPDTMTASAPATAGSGGSVPDTTHSDSPSSSGSAQAVIEIPDTSTSQSPGVCHGSTDGSHPRTSSAATPSTAKPPTPAPDPVKNPNLSFGHKNPKAPAKTLSPQD